MSVGHGCVRLIGVTTGARVYLAEDDSHDPMTTTRHPLATTPPAPHLLQRLSPDRVPTVYDPRYVSRAAPLTSTTKAGLVMAARADDLDVLTPLVDGETDDAPGEIWASIGRWHAAAYVEAVRTGTPRRLAQSQGFTWSPEFAQSVARIWHGQHVAQRLARDLGRAVLHPVSGAHHAHPAVGGGFCTFNYVVAALDAIRDADPQARVAVVDLDAHYGDGTVAFAAQCADLHVFDIHGAYGRATETEVHGRRAVGYGAADRAAYVAALLHLPEWLRAHGITDVCLLAGVDPFADDPVGGIRGMTAAALFLRDLYALAVLQSLGIATVVNFAGGYVPDKVVELHGGTIRAMQVVRLLGPFAEQLLAD